jgi:GTP cyclohydrolase IB
MVDVATQKDSRGIYINNVGITQLTMPISVRDKENDWQNTTGIFNVFVDLAAERKGTHMSRLVEIVYKYRKNINHDGLERMCKELLEKLGATHATVEVEFPYFTTIHSPITKTENMMTHVARFTAEHDGSGYDFQIGVDVEVMTVCPCALQECGNGNSHVQRGTVSIDVMTEGWVWLESIISAAQASGSSPVYDRLKRPDEAATVKYGFKHAQFVEDVVRTAVLCIRSIDGVKEFRVRVENQESIHTHNAYAEVESPGFSQKVQK